MNLRHAFRALVKKPFSSSVAILVSTLLLAMVALGAGAMPALRTARVDPIRALRYE